MRQSPILLIHVDELQLFELYIIFQWVNQVLSLCVKDLLVWYFALNMWQSALQIDYLLRQLGIFLLHDFALVT